MKLGDWRRGEQWRRRGRWEGFLGQVERRGIRLGLQNGSG